MLKLVRPQLGLQNVCAVMFRCGTNPFQELLRSNLSHLSFLPRQPVQQPQITT